MIHKIQFFFFKAIIEKKTILHKQFNYNNIIISRTKNSFYGHFQLNNCFEISESLKIEVKDLYNLFKEAIAKSEYNECLILHFFDPYFINFSFTKNFLESSIVELNKRKKKYMSEKIILDYSGPNIAKHMHVGHLRSTIIGECLSNIFKYLGNKIIKISHLGDWGLQFGILIGYIKEKYKEVNFNDIKFTLDELSKYYKLGNELYFNNFIFQNISKKEVVKLHNNDEDSLKLWKKIVNISKMEYKKIYNMLDISIQQKGESFYKNILSSIIIFLEKKGLIKEKEQAKCVFFKNLNDEKDFLVMQKTDGAFNYSTTEFASLYYRIKYHRPDKIIYITDIGQKLHFDMVFGILNSIKNFNNRVKLFHIGLGLMLNKDGKKIKTRNFESEKLIDFIKNAIIISSKIIKSKDKFISRSKLKENSFKLALNTIKYADLSHSFEQNYIFDYDKMLMFKGNTATFLMYAYVRVCGIVKKIKFKNPTKIYINNEFEIDLSIHLIQYYYIIIRAADKMNTNILTLYLYQLAEKFHSFFHSCRVLDSEFLESRYFLCVLTKKVLRIFFNILGFKIINKM